MSYKEMKFKGNRVFVEVDAEGSPMLAGNRARMKYRLADERVYNPNVNNLTELDEAPEVIEAAVQDPTTPSEKPTQQTGSQAGVIIAYTDGACIGNPGPSGLGYVISYPDGTRVQAGEPLGTGTNNIAELTAILRVCETACERRIPIVIHTDSEYAIGVLVLGWKAKANRSLIDSIKQAMGRCMRVELRKVKGHAGVPENELVDRLARKAAQTQSATNEA
ncbi:MAG: ribonuclease H [Myxococcota bacterium]|nr:ribonuclease H [Myxococcota bacterium]